ncbi:MAG: glycosyltransferase family 4 protein, partial [Candidatus Uhrbacteria bacterium]|nr:glycosyltransferase family 4 protein [Candidatus Uhrbacteria bacterium]
MHLGIDAHLLLREKATGVERYAKFLLEQMMVTSPADVRVTLYGHDDKPTWLTLRNNWTWKKLGWSIGRGWTHGRLSLEMLMHPPDVLFVPGHEVPAFMRSKTKVVTTLHDVAFKRNPETYSPSAVQRQDLAVRRAIKRAARILVPSEASKLDLAEFFNVPFDRVVVTHLAPTMPPTGSADTLARLHLRPGSYFFFLSRLEAKKGVVDLIRAFTFLKQRLGHGDPHQLVLVGSFGYGGEVAKRAIEESEAKADIRVLGYVENEDVRTLLDQSLALVMPSLAEGFGIPVLEAMASGVPVIASDIPALREVAGEAALFSRPGDVSSLLEVMQRMVFDGGLREKFIADGTERVKQFSWEKCA